MDLTKLKQRNFLISNFIFLFIPWIILAIIFGMYDLQISNSIVNFDSWWGKFGANFGESPGYGLIGISIAILFGSLFKDLKLQKLPAFIIIALTNGVMIYGLVISSNKMAIISGIISLSLVLFVAIKFNSDWNYYKKYAWIVILLAILNPLLFVQITKILCGRVRYRELVDLGFEYYTPWYLPPGPSLLYSSFPSGHTSMGWMLLPLIVIIYKKELRNFVKILLIIPIIFWGLFVSSSRVVIGAHFASDVLFSTGMAFFVMIMLYYVFYIRKRKEKEIIQNNLLNEITENS
ncbi:MAG: phosphatase PAP2 family protein [Candidatus Heimdallarchaeota archaeon]|nr:phosphatase PAP2 family protein [Candidatus Heimdallarchaeota archaeon]